MGLQNDLEGEGRKAISDLLHHLDRRKRELVGAPDIAKLIEPAPPEVEKYLNLLGVLDGIKKKGRKAISDFYFHAGMQLGWAADFDEGGDEAPSKDFRPLNPAMREKVKSISKRLTRLIDMAVSDDLKGIDLLLGAQSALEKFRKQFVKRKPGRLTGKDYLRRWGWYVRPPTAAFAFFVLLRRYSKPTLTKRRAYERIRYLHADLFKLNVGADSVEKQISRFVRFEDSQRIRRFVTVIEKLPPFRETE
jgi:hypothetical protein